jgi:5'-3' exonuclease
VTYALIDGDIICYRASIVQQDVQRWEGELISCELTGSVASAREYALSLVKSWTTLANQRRAIVCFTGSNNFRKRLLPSYKANRVTGKPLVYQETVMAVEERFRTERLEGLEADDLLGILATTLPKYAGAVVVSLDKDMRTFPGTHLNPLKDKVPFAVSEALANWNWMKQTLMGDSSDGYEGLRGVGEVKAGKILGEHLAALETLWSRVAKAFIEKGKTVDAALVQARMARILRAEDWNKGTKEIRLWHPTAPLWIPVKSSSLPTATCGSPEMVTQGSASTTPDTPSKSQSGL